MKIKTPFCTNESILSYIQNQMIFPSFREILEEAVLICSQHGLDYKQGRDIHITETDAFYLSFFSNSIDAKMIVDIGTSLGVSASVFAMKEDVTVYTFEQAEENFKVACDLFEKRKLSQRINSFLGNAHELLETITGPFDLIFIDAEKKGYVDYFHWAEKHISKGGLIIADNVFALGSISEENTPPPLKKIKQYITEYNSYVMSHNGFKSMFLPTGEGLLISCKI